jgi:DHA2 family multidrug resistance protein-like MFS transporter
MSRDPRLVLVACCLAMLAVGENSTAIMAALPAMTSSLRIGPATVEWAVNAYLLASAVFIIVGGEAADQFGARRSSAVGIALFALASLLIAIAPDGVVVVGARALQGLGAAFAVAGTLAAVTEAAPEKERAGAIGAWTGFLMLGFSIGPLVGGVVTHYAGWRVNFWLNVLAMLPAGLALWLHPGTADRQTKPVDWLGLGLLAFFMVMLVHGLHALATARSAPLAAIVPLVLAAMAFAALLWAETRHHRPLLDFGLFSNPNFALSCLLAFLLMFDIMTILLYYNLFAQAPDGLGLTAVAAGLSLMPLSVALFGFARAAPRLGAALGLRRMMVGGSLLLALGCAIAWASLAGAGFAVLMLGLFAAGAGIALPYASAPRIGLAALPQTQAGKGSGVLNSCSFLGGTVGVTVGGIVFDLAGFEGVLALVGLSALVAGGLSLRLRAA